jgi:hypothetical protein
MPGKNSKKSTSRRKSPASDERTIRAAKKATKKGAVRSSKAVASKARKDAPVKEAPAKTVSVKSPLITRVERIQPLVDLGRIWEHIGFAPTFEFRVSFARPDDLLVCDFIFDNFKLAGGKLVRDDHTRAATLIVELPPQSFGEEAFLDATGPEVASPPAGKEKFQESSQDAPAKNVAVTNAEPLDPLPFAKIRMAGRSRLAFSMPGTETELAFTLEAILNACRRWPMRLDVNAVPEPESRFFIGEVLKDITVFNKEWLRSVTTAGEMARATQTLLLSVEGAGELERPLVAAAKRIATRASEALRVRATKGIQEEFKRVMNAELDTLARRFTSLRGGEQRSTALAALSLLTTQEVAESTLGEFTLGSIEAFPFLTVIFAPHKPSPKVTALELPYRVISSPIPKSNWWHQTKPVAHNGRTELWHTRLTRTTDGIGPDPATQVRALWSPDYDLGEDEIIQIVNTLKPYRMSLDPLDRQMLVKLMAGFNERDVDENVFVPRAARSQRLALSALGALLDIEGNWNILPANVGLEQWRHLATLGRDHYVRVVYRGFLFPFGHSASLIKVTERKFEYLDQAAKKNRVAVLRQRFFIVVREPVKQYSGAGHAFGGRNFPFTSVEILTRVTPSLRAPDLSKLNDPANKIYSAIPFRACFWPMLSATKNFVFQIAATDLCGERVTFAMPLLFVGVEANQNDNALAEIIKQYDQKAEIPRRTASLGGAAVCYAPEKAGAEGDPRLPTTEMTFDAAPVTGIAKSKPRFYPETETAQVGIAAVQRLLQKPEAMVPVAYPEVYKTAGFGGANSGEVFLKTLQPFGLEFGNAVKSDALGGLATPSMAIQGLSRIMGPVSAQPPSNPTPANIETALAKVISNKFDPADFFKGAKILGGVDLSTILDIATSLVGGDVPKLLSKQLPDRIEARFDWSTKINKSDPLGLFVPKADGKDTLLKMRGVVSSPIAQPTATTFEAVASINNFKVNLFGFIIVWFDELRFTSKSGSKPDVAVDLHPGSDAIAFGGPLEFVNTLRDIIPSNGFSDPPSLSITPSGISASYSLNVPSVQVGIFALEHVSLGAGFALPFDAKPVEVRFNFSERQRPFSLTVSLLGGGGFFAIGVGAEGVREIEAALEFGAALSINLGVASGSVEIKAGVYFHWTQTSVELAGYVRLHGELSVLGLISASITFNLQIAYLKENGHSVVWGEASVEVEIDILFFSFSVSVKCRREFGGAEGDPKFIELIPDQRTWTNYCEAYAEEAA